VFNLKGNAMKWSWKLGRFAGIDVYMHATFLLIIAFVAFSYWQIEPTLNSVVSGVGFTLILFACVVLHEYGHALTARRYGIETRDITLLPIGGVARLEKMPDNPREELWVALAGPAVNVVIGALLFLVLAATSALGPITGLGIGSGSFLERLMVVNFFLVGFNLIPAFPMDGGRVVRALLAMRIEYARATQIAARLGQGLAVVFAIVGLRSNPMLVLIAIFVWIGAAQETSMVQMKSTVGGVPVSRVMFTDYRVLSPFHRLSYVMELMLQGSQQDFPVLENGRVVGLLTRRDLIAALSRFGENALVRDVMRRDFESVDAFEMLETGIAKLQSSGISTMPVTSGGSLVGILTIGNIREFLAIQSALKPARVNI
jgi:Zn-dependent protease